MFCTVRRRNAKVRWKVLVKEECFRNFDATRIMKFR
jgi:hypothetical protein